MRSNSKTVFNNLFEFYSHQCSAYADKLLFDNVISYSKTFELMEKRGAFLQRNNFSRGDVIAILSSNSYEWCITYMAITSAGMIALPLDTNLPIDSYNAIIEFASAKAVFVSPEYSYHIKCIPVYAISFDDSIETNYNFSPPAVSLSDSASFVCTSGTTGKPKVVILTHNNIISTPIVCSDYLLNSDDFFLCILPLFHVYAFVANFIGPFRAGCKLYFLRSLKGPDIVKTLSDYSFSCLPAAPQLWELFFDSILKSVKNKSVFLKIIFHFFLRYSIFFKKIGLGLIPDTIFKPVRSIFGPKMRFFISGGAPLKRRYYNYYRSIGFNIVEGYGLTETTGPIMLSNDRNTLGKVYKAGSVGKVMPGNLIKLKNINHEGIGEIFFKGNSVFAGYLKDSNATKDAFDDEGYFNTGDIGRFDKDGDLFLTGRKKNTIILDSGKNVYPDEIEEQIKKSNKISDVCVFGKIIKSKETVVAVIVPASKTGDVFGDISKVIEEANRCLPTYKRIMKFAVSIDPLPKNTTRKTLVDEVKRLFDSGSFQTDANNIPALRMPLLGNNQKEDAIIELLKQKLGKTILYANQPIRDFDLDSLQMIDMISYFEEALSISVDQSKINSIETLEDLVLFISAGIDKTSGGIDDQILNGTPSTNIRSFYNPIVELLLLFVKLISKLCWGLSSENIDMLRTDNCVIASNHQSYLDILWIYSLIPYKIRKSIFITGKKEVSFFRFLLPGAPVIFIEREGNVIPSLKASSDVLRSGKSLIIFPEGTRTNNGSLGIFKNGAAYLSKNLNKQIIPLTIRGGYEVYPKDRTIPRFFRKARVEIVVGNPIDPEMYATSEALNQVLRNAILGKLIQ